MSLAAVVAGLGLLAVLPPYRVSALHVLFIGAFSDPEQQRERELRASCC